MGVVGVVYVGVVVVGTRKMSNKLIFFCLCNDTTKIRLDGDEWGTNFPF